MPFVPPSQQTRQPCQNKLQERKEEDEEKEKKSVVRVRKRKHQAECRNNLPTASDLQRDKDLKHTTNEK